jgi:methane/ammonia monooxygenase subunit B
MSAPVAVSLALLLTSFDAAAHGERAQQANTRMRTLNWYDIEIGPAQVAVGERMSVKGRFRTSKQWPEHIPSVEDMVFLNVGAGGPNFIRLSSNIDGVSAVQSTSLELGKDYSFAMELKARRPGRFHVHPILNVRDAGSMVGPGRWVEVTGSAADFENTVQSMFGRDISLETFHLKSIVSWHAIWFVIGGGWLFYWLRQRPLLIPRLRAVDELNEKDRDPDELISSTDIKVAIGFLGLTLLVIVAGFAWGERDAPITIPLRTAKTNMPDDKPFPAQIVKVKVEEASYRIPGRSFRMQLSVHNHGNATLQIGEFLTANVRFINPKVRSVKPIDEHDLVAAEGLRVEGGVIGPGEAKTVNVFAEDALWETQRLTRMINDPDSVIAGLLFFYGDDGSREIVEVGGSIVPIFN